VEVGVSDNTIGERRRRLRELVVTLVDFQRLWAIADRTTRRHEFARVAAHLYDCHPEVFGPFGEECVPLCEEVGAAVEESAEQLRPTVWAVRVHYGWWFKLGWLARVWHRLMGDIPRCVGGRPIEEWHAELGAAADGGGKSGGRRKHWPIPSANFWCGLLGGVGLGLGMSAALAEPEALASEHQAWVRLVGAVLVGIGLLGAVLVGLGSAGGLNGWLARRDR
jgi:hypothetical protein